MDVSLREIKYGAMRELYLFEFDGIARAEAARIDAAMQNGTSAELNAANPGILESNAPGDDGVLKRKARKILAFTEIEAANDEGLDKPERNYVLDRFILAHLIYLAGKKGAEKSCADDLLIECACGVPATDGLRRPLHLFDQALFRLSERPDARRQ